MNRRNFLSTTALSAAALPACSKATGEAASAAKAAAAVTEGAAESLYKISLAQWSLNRRIREKDGAEPLDHMDFAKTARELGIGAVEYVSALWKDGADPYTIIELKMRAIDEDVENLLIMVDGEGDLGDPSTRRRKQTIDNHKQWLDAAAELGCHAIRVNAASSGKPEMQVERAAEGLVALGNEGEQRGIDILVENHGGLSSSGYWLPKVMEKANHKRVGTLPDFGNFFESWKGGELFDPYEGVDLMMPWARGLSAKAFDWDTGAGEFVSEDKREATALKIDFQKMLEIACLKHGYRGYVGIEYEGHQLPEMEGIVRTKKALDDLNIILAKKAAEMPAADSEAQKKAA